MSDSKIRSSIQLKGLSKAFDPQAELVIDGLNLDVAQGEFVSIVGASGCGKTTLLNIIAGLTEQSEGSVVTLGTRTIIFQESALMPWLSARENIELPLVFRGVEKKLRAQRSDELLHLVNLESAADKRPHQLSGGMRQRVAIARALAQESQILLMDEPFAALDAITRDVLHDELSRIWRDRGLSILFVTHNVREAVRLGQRVLLMSSRPGRFISEWKVEIPEPRRIDSPEVAMLAREITDRLRMEIRRHA